MKLSVRLKVLEAREGGRFLIYFSGPKVELMETETAGDESDFTL